MLRVGDKFDKAKTEEGHIYLYDKESGIVDEIIQRTECEVWSRCMGYHRPTSAWNPGKRQEHADRTHFKEPIQN